jgi:hypothetical protein
MVVDFIGGTKQKTMHFTKEMHGAQRLMLF